MERRGITSDQLAKTLADGLAATKVLRKTQFAEREIVPDFGERRQSVELAAKLRGDMDSAQVNMTFNEWIASVPDEYAERFGLVETPDTPEMLHSSGKVIDVHAIETPLDGAGEVIETPAPTDEPHVDKA